MLIGLRFDHKTAFYSVLVYILLSVSWFPIFVDFPVDYFTLLGAIGGYLIGFLAAVIVMVWWINC
ncbi:biotin transporter BioY [Wolbachia endosymbiont of Dirofilaria (Dirofilaria) immitis]|uniref:biotin transporter BioY n=1 Tax=Wolbachia endosymbiont of Dirofilaria (Dirofilaria) immitis TaxID=1812115 RepID=UPI001FE3268B|nr:biotin transporter BioY [Wolbachia endosymbiont of Dirofilaria (Dirofilaria) immitis]